MFKDSILREDVTIYLCPHSFAQCYHYSLDIAMADTGAPTRMYVYRLFSKKLCSSYQIGTEVISSNETEVKILPLSHSFTASFGIHTTVLSSSDLSAQTVTS